MHPLQIVKNTQSTTDSGSEYLCFVQEDGGGGAVGLFQLQLQQPLLLNTDNHCDFTLKVHNCNIIVILLIQSDFGRQLLLVLLRIIQAALIIRSPLQLACWRIHRL